jgi:CRISPR-associated protein Cas8b1/Cst1 subtype I-B
MSVHQGACHCKAVAFEFDADIESGVQCDCSMCKRRNAVMLRLPQEKFRLLKGADALSLYQWNTRVAKHYFCKHCGIYTHHQMRSRPELFGVNLGCVDDVDTRKVLVTWAEGSKLSGA